MRLDKKTHDHDVQRSKENALKRKAKWEERANLERAQMENKSNPRRIRMLSGFYGTEKYVQNIWIVLPIRMPREEFKDRLRKGFSDVGEI